MRILFDISHPAHVHFYRHMIATLQRDGHSYLVIARDKDVTRTLLDRFGIQAMSVGRAGRRGRLSDAAELIARDAFIVRRGWSFRPDVICTRNPSGVQAARVLRIPGIFDTDDGRAAGIHFRLAAPFAHIITTPDCIEEDYGPKHRRYPGYKALAYLHPDRFTPDPGVRAQLGVGPDEPYAIVRFVAFQASHDRGEGGLDSVARRRVVDVLERRGRVFVSSEAPLPADLEHARLPISADRIHDALAFATIWVGDSQTMAAEAAILGTPALHYSSWSGRLAYLVELETRYDLVHSFGFAGTADFFATLEEWVADESLKPKWKSRRDSMLSDKCDVTSWYLDLLTEVAG